MPDRFYLDFNGPYGTTEELRRAGYDVVHVQDLRTSSRTDAFHLLEAFRDDRILVNRNADDFRLLHDAWRRWLAAPHPSLPPHRGILCLPQYRPTELRALIETLLASGQPIANECYFCDRFKRWHHDPYKP